MEKLLPAMLDVLGFVLLLCSTIQEGQGKGEYQPNTGAASINVHTHSGNRLSESKTLQRSN